MSWLVTQTCGSNALYLCGFADGPSWTAHSHMAHVFASVSEALAAAETIKANGHHLAGYSVACERRHEQAGESEWDTTGSTQASSNFGSSESESSSHDKASVSTVEETTMNETDGNVLRFKAPITLTETMRAKIAEVIYGDNLHTETIEHVQDDHNYTPERVEALLDQARSIASERAKQERDAWFVQAVMDYHEGCDEGKSCFLESIGLEAPTTTVTVTVEFEVKTHVAGHVQYDSLVERALNRYDDDDYVSFSVWEG